MAVETQEKKKGSDSKKLKKKKLNYFPLYFIFLLTFLFVFLINQKKESAFPIVFFSFP